MAIFLMIFIVYMHKNQKNVQVSAFLADYICFIT